MLGRINSPKRHVEDADLFDDEAFNTSYRHSDLCWRYFIQQSVRLA